MVRSQWQKQNGNHRSSLMHVSNLLTARGGTFTRNTPSIFMTLTDFIKSPINNLHKTRSHRSLPVFPVASRQLDRNVSFHFPKNHRGNAHSLDCRYKLDRNRVESLHSLRVTKRLPTCQSMVQPYDYRGTSNLKPIEQLLQPQSNRR